MCGSFGGKGWHNQLQHVKEHTNRRIGGCEAHHTQKLYSLEYVSNQSVVIGKEGMEHMTLSTNDTRHSREPQRARRGQDP